MSRRTVEPLARRPAVAVLALASAIPGACRGRETDVVRVGVASNFAAVAEVLAARFEAETGFEVALSRGSTGKLSAQIENGAPFDVLLAADVERPQRLEQLGLAVEARRVTYALGRLVLWSPDPELVDASGELLARGRFRRLAIANPDLAPYGRAAREVLEARGLWEALQPRLVRGENIGQAFQFVHGGGAELGFVAASQVPDDGSTWLVPEGLYSPIEQQAVLLSDREPARVFLSFVCGEVARAIIRRSGYDTP